MSSMYSVLISEETPLLYQLFKTLSIDEALAKVEESLKLTKENFSKLDLISSDLKEVLDLLKGSSNCNINDVKKPLMENKDLISSVNQFED